jgi:hypothetical protein
MNDFIFCFIYIYIYIYIYMKQSIIYIIQTCNQLFISFKNLIKKPTINIEEIINNNNNNNNKR